MYFTKKQYKLLIFLEKNILNGISVFADTVFDEVDLKFVNELLVRILFLNLSVYI